MGKIKKLTLNKEFKRAYYQGKYKAHPTLVTYMVKNDYGYCRLGISTSKKIGTACERNRARRVLYAAYQMNEDDFKQWLSDPKNKHKSFDVVLMARKDTIQQKSTTLESTLHHHLKCLLKQHQNDSKKYKKTTKNI